MARIGGVVAGLKLQRKCIGGAIASCIEHAAIRVVLRQRKFLRKLRAPSGFGVGSQFGWDEKLEQSEFRHHVVQSDDFRRLPGNKSNARVLRVKELRELEQRSHGRECSKVSASRPFAPVGLHGVHHPAVEHPAEPGHGEKVVPPVREGQPQHGQVGHAEGLVAHALLAGTEGGDPIVNVVSCHFTHPCDDTRIGFLLPLQDELIERKVERHADVIPVAPRRWQVRPMTVASFHAQFERLPHFLGLS